MNIVVHFENYLNRDWNSLSCLKQPFWTVNIVLQFKTSSYFDWNSLFYLKQSFWTVNVIMKFKTYFKCDWNSPSLHLFQNLPSLKLSQVKQNPILGSPDSDKDILGYLDYTPDPLPDITDSEYLSIWHKVFYNTFVPWGIPHFFFFFFFFNPFQCHRRLKHH